MGVTSVQLTGRKPGDTFDIGSSNVHYTAFDDRKNQATCSFTVHLKSKCELGSRDKPFLIALLHTLNCDI